MSIAIRNQPAKDRARVRFGDLVVECLPQLRVYARSLTGRRDAADDLVQDAVVRALAARHSFTPGTNLRAWLFTILRNACFSNYRRNQLQLTCIEELPEGRLAMPPRQLGQLELQEVERSIQELPMVFREALLMVSVAGMNYAEASAEAGCAVGTTKSRVNRARSHLRRIRGEAPMPEQHEQTQALSG
jgi:RNA polymerase sigma-70 factor, ECF subfamily